MPLGLILSEDNDIITPGKPDFIGIPARSAPVAQGREHRIPNPGAAGSNPARCTILNLSKSARRLELHASWVLFLLPLPFIYWCIAFFIHLLKI